MLRRSFLAAFGGLAAGQPVFLEAFVAPRLPHVLKIYRFTPLAIHQIYELRTYRSPNYPPLRALDRAGIHPLYIRSSSLPRSAVYLIPFADLEARQKAWSAFEADDNWQSIRGQSTVSEIALYRVAATTA